MELTEDMIEVFQIAAYHEKDDPSAPLFIDVSMLVSTPERAREIASWFPKSVGLKATSIVRCDAGSGFIAFRVVLSKNGVNGGVNETGVKRYQSLIKHAVRHDVRREYVPGRSVNAYPTREALNEAIGI